MGPRVAELNVHQLNDETRAYRVIGWQEGRWAIEYLDNIQYAVKWQPQDVVEMLEQGWQVDNTFMDNVGDVIYLFRRVKPESESADD